MRRMDSGSGRRIGGRGLPWGFNPRDLIYKRKLLGAQPDDLIAAWGLFEGNGAVAFDLSPKGHDGAYANVTLGQPGIGDGHNCPLFDAATSYVNVWSTGLRDDINGAEMTLLQWIRMRALGVWTDGVTRYGCYFFGGGNDRFGFRKLSNDNFEYTSVSGGVNKSHSIIAPTDVDWMCMILTVSEAEDESVSYKDGDINTTLSGLGNWGGTVASAVLGAGDLVPNNVHDGWLGPGALWTAPLSPNKAGYLSTP